MNRRTNESQSGKNVRTAANRRGRKACQPSLPGVERLEPRSMMSVNPVSPPPAEPIDGVGNNVAHPTWGSVGQDLLRLSPAAYGDGISSPSGADQPSARLVSNLLSASPEGGVTNDRDMTAFVYVWGQFIDHDMGLTTSASPTERLPISVPTGDPSFDPNGTGTMTISMSRSNWDAATGTSTANVRQQINSITAFIDGSNVYGSDATRAAALREFVGGRLRTSAGNLMPFNTDGLADYNTVRVAYGLPRVTSFAQITPDTAVQSALQQAYGTVDKIDLWVGGLAEKHLPNSSVGQTFTAIMVDQFKRLQSGDRSWYQNVLPASAVSTIQKTTLGDIIRRNTQLTNLQSDVFVLHTSIAGTAFVDGNRDGTRQQREGGIANATVSLVTAAGATVATTRTDARGDYVFRGMDLGSFSVVVTPPAVNGQTPPSVTSRTVAITRGMDARLNVALPPKPATPGPKPAGSQPSTLSPSAAVFAGIGAGMPGAPMAPGVRKR